MSLRPEELKFGTFTWLFLFSVSLFAAASLLSTLLFRIQHLDPRVFRRHLLELALSSCYIQHSISLKHTHQSIAFLNSYHTHQTPSFLRLIDQV